MPIALDPEQTFEVPPAEERKPDGPVFVFRYLTARAWLAAAQFGDDRETLNNLTTAQIVGRLCETIVDGQRLVTWRNVRDEDGADIPFDPDGLSDVLTVAELWDLYYAARRGSVLGPEAKKDSGSPSPSDGADSATAPAGAGTAPTDRPRPSPPSSSVPPAEASAATPAEESGSSGSSAARSST